MSGVLRPLVAALVMLALLAAGCKNVPMLPGLTTHKIDVQQGNVVTQDMVAKLKPGMTRQQVRFIMGTPPISDVFHADRWDYVYYLNRGGRVVEQRRLVLRFEGEVLKLIEGDVVPASATGAAKPPEGSRTVGQSEAKPSGPPGQPATP
jgi:outer membrane protein assembly factor BamE